MEVKSAKFSSVTVVFTGENGGASVCGRWAMLLTGTSDSEDEIDGAMESSSSEMNMLGYAIAHSMASNLLWCTERTCDI